MPIAIAPVQPAVIEVPEPEAPPPAPRPNTCDFEAIAAGSYSTAP
jgi:hypothetical protein